MKNKNWRHSRKLKENAKGCAIQPNTVGPMSCMCLTRLQKCNRVQWHMLFHPTALSLEFCNPLTFEQMCIFCAYCVLAGWNVTQRILWFIHGSSMIPSPSYQYFILIGSKETPPSSQYPLVLTPCPFLTLCCEKFWIFPLVRTKVPQIVNDLIGHLMSVWNKTHSCSIW